MATPKFTTLADGRTQITLTTGQAQGGIGALIIGGIGLGFVTALGLWTDSPNVVLYGCGSCAGLVVVLGIWLIVAAALVAGRVSDATLTLSHYPLRLGERFSVLYEQPVRGTHEIVSVTLTLQCQEVAKYRVGTDTRTVKHTALEVQEVLLESGTATPGSTLASEVQFEIPAAAMHTFDHSNNKFLWTLRLKTNIAKLPDYVAECNLSVVPRLAPGLAPADGAPPAELRGGEDEALDDAAEEES